MAEHLQNLRDRYIVANARWVIRNAWSFWLGIANAILTAGTGALLIAAPLVPLKYLLPYAIFAFLVSVTPPIARLFRQKKNGACDVDVDEQ